MLCKLPLVVGLVDMTRGLWSSFADHPMHPKSSNVFGCLLQEIAPIPSDSMGFTEGDS